ncbi:hypothetical protein ACFFGH_09445 [Lysobacter korlensis]|uniref:Uncharacterized protein n=1 Tax=Lysobacter korlensis TaxID=553636 RepID=A0ABV6RM58_9GAMM
MADQKLIFHRWVRERMAGLATAVQDGRPLVQAQLTLAGTDAAGSATASVTRTARFLLSGPGDVVGLAPRAVIKRYPSPGAVDHESDRCAHVEFADPALPWRYTPAPKPAAGSGALHPWLVLVVGTEGTELTLAADKVTLSPEVQAAHPLGAAGGAYPWAHVQVDAEGRRVARILSGRPLNPGADYVAVLVPAFDEAGNRRWTGGAPVLVPLYDHWRFRTATPAGSFEDLAARLKPGAADSETGRAPLDYPRVPAAGDLLVRGALAPIGATDAPLAAEIRADLENLRTPARDERGRPIVGLPRYGEAWRSDAPEQTVWGGTLNTDPRDRGVAGLGLDLGIRLQEELAEEAAANLGALSEARQRIAQLSAGLRASGALWRRRLPADPLAALWLLGPALARVVTESGTVEALATAPDRALPPGVFSSAARRILRPGPARTALAAGPVTARDLLLASNRCPPAAERRDDGLALEQLDLRLKRLIGRLREVLDTGDADLRAVAEAAQSIAEQSIEPLRDFAMAIAARLAESADAGTPAPWAEGLSLLIRARDVAPEDEAELGRLFIEMRTFLARYPEPAGREDVAEVLTGLVEEPPEEPRCTPVDLDALAEGVLAAFDPTRPDASAVVRVIATLNGLDPAQPLAPPEACIGLDRPIWADVRTAFPEWLLPGVGALPEDSVIAVETNARFVDSLLTGLNTQLLEELRWRNIPVATGCTPLRVFWDRADTASGARVDDITGILNWGDGSDVGEPQHRPPGVSGRDLVVVVRGHLFLRYPSTVVYLVTARHGGAPDFARDPDPAAIRILPTFQGRIGADVTFFGFQGFVPDDITSHWLVFEEPPAGYRFDNSLSSAPEADVWAAASLALPVRVLIRGDRLDPEGPV